jgi:hypothetical protein
MKSRKVRNPIQVSSFEVITREDGALVQHAGKFLASVHSCDGGFEIRQGGRWVFRSVSLRSVARWLEDEIIRRVTR